MKVMNTDKKTNLDVMHESPQRWQGDPGQVPQAAALHIEDDDVAFGQTVLRQLDVIEHAEDSDSISEVQLAVVEVGEPVEQDVIALTRLVGKTYHVPGI